MKTNESQVGMDVRENTMPLGIFLSEKRPKAKTSLSLPTTAYWTGGPDAMVADPDA